MKQPLELSSSARSAAPKPSPILGSAASEPGHTAWKTPATPLSGHRPALTPSHHREPMAVHVRVPTLPMSLPAARLQPKKLHCILLCPWGSPWHNAAKTQGHWKMAQHKVKRLTRRIPCAYEQQEPTTDVSLWDDVWSSPSSSWCLSRHGMKISPVLGLGHLSFVLRALTPIQSCSAAQGKRDISSIWSSPTTICCQGMCLQLPEHLQLSA